MNNTSFELCLSLGAKMTPRHAVGCVPVGDWYLVYFLKPDVDRMCFTSPIYAAGKTPEEAFKKLAEKVTS